MRHCAQYFEKKVYVHYRVVVSIWHQNALDKDLEAVHGNQMKSFINK